MPRLNDPTKASAGQRRENDACGASLSARCFNGALGCRVHPVRHHEQEARQFCHTGPHSATPAVTLHFDGGARRLHWCAEHASDADQYREDADR